MIATCNANCHVLHVEDHGGDALIVERLVERIDRDIKLVRVPDGESALAYIRDARDDRRVDVVLLDLKLPKMQGTEVLDRIRADRSIQDTPVVALTSSQDESNARMCRERGVNGYLLKDDGPAVLSGKLARIFGLWCNTAANTPDDTGETGSFSGIDGNLRRRRADLAGPVAASRLLIVDDSAADASMMARYLDAFEHLEIVTTSESREADAMLRNESFDVVLLDYRMPGLSGLDYLDVIRRRDADVGIVMVTAFSEEKVAITAIQRRVDDYLRKEDLTREGLVDTVERLLIRVRRRRSATIDPVTGLFCATAINDGLTEAFDRLQERDNEVSLLLIDLDEFANLNERQGRATGDRVLRRIANALSNALNSGDIVGRYRDDEFCIIAAGTDLRRSRDLAERLRECIRRIRFDYGDGEFSVDCSVGVAHFRESVPDSTDAAMKLAYEALLKARSAGERVHVLHPPSPDAADSE